MITRPLKLQDPEKVKKIGDAFFSECDEKGDPYTMTGLAISLGIDRQTLLDYKCGMYSDGENNEKISDLIKGFLSRCENYAEKCAYKNNPTGPIFILKNHGWSDKQDVDLHVDGQISVLDAFNAMKNR